MLEFSQHWITYWKGTFFKHFLTLGIVVSGEGGGRSTKTFDLSFRPSMANVEDFNSALKKKLLISGVGSLMVGHFAQNGLKFKYLFWMFIPQLKIVLAIEKWTNDSVHITNFKEFWARGGRDTVILIHEIKSLREGWILISWLFFFFRVTGGNKTSRNAR